MGYMRHHAIIVSSWDHEAVEVARAKAVEIFGRPVLPSPRIAEVTPVTGPAANGYHTFLVAPDGSKEGWAHSDAGDAARAEFVDWLRENGRMEWVELQFADEEGEDRVLQSSSFDGEGE